MDYWEIYEISSWNRVQVTNASIPLQHKAWSWHQQLTRNFVSGRWGNPGACTSGKLHPFFPGPITRGAEPGCRLCQLLPTQQTRNVLQTRAAFPSPLGREERCPWGYSAAPWAFRAWISLISGQAYSEMSLLQPGHFYSRNGHRGFSFPELLMDYIRVINKAFCLGRDSHVHFLARHQQNMFLLFPQYYNLNIVR